MRSRRCGDTVRVMLSRAHRRWFPVIALLALWLPAGCTQKGEQAGSATAGIPTIRVRLLEAQSQVTIASSNSFAFREAPGVRPRQLNVAKSKPVSVLRTNAGWRVGDQSVETSELTLIAMGEGGNLSINGKPYRGSCRLVPVGPGKFDVVNDVDLEGYLKGVVSKELYPDWHEEAFKAQAIVARTYALYEMKTSGLGRRWDVHPDERSQVYGGIGGENGSSRTATDATAGVVVAYGPSGEERIFKAYFSSCCGGIAQSAVDAFGVLDIEPLSDRMVGNRCNMSPKYNWGPIVFTKDELTRRLKRWGAAKSRTEKDMAAVVQIDRAAYNRHGRPTRFTVTDARGQRFSMNGTELRSAINSGAGPGEQTVPSSFFTPANEEKVIRFVDGHGFGHGVGLCQWCAQAQAESGVPHEQIVLDAFRGATLQRAY
jgi:stage II sporulation protein D